jgi:O-antigen/teichoic acid export membrane protein
LKLQYSKYWLKSGLYTFFQRFSLTLFGLINFIILVRYLSKAEMGTWALFLIITTVFETTKSGLLKNAHIRFITITHNDREKNEIATSSLVINATISVIFIVFLLGFASMLPKWLNAEVGLGSMMTWFIPGIAGMVIFSHFEAIQQSNLDFQGVFVGHFFRQLSFLLMIVYDVVMKNPLTLNKLALYQSISIAIGSVFIFYYSRKYISYRFAPTMAAIKKIVGYGKYIFTSTALANIASNIDQVMTSSFLSSSAVAYYNTASRINLLIDIPSYAAAEILFPKTSMASHSADTHKVKYYYEKMVAILMSFTLPAAIFILIFPKVAIFLIAGPSYYDATPILQLYILTGILRPMQNQAANTLNAAGKPQLCLKINAIMVCIYLAINFICLYYIGFYGAAVGTFITTVIGTAYWYFTMRKEIGLEIRNVIRYIEETYRMIFGLLRGFRLNSLSNFNKKDS